MVGSYLLTSCNDHMSEYSFRINYAYILMKPVKCVQMSRSDWELQSGV